MRVTHPDGERTGGGRSPPERPGRPATTRPPDSTTRKRALQRESLKKSPALSSDSPFRVNLKVIDLPVCPLLGDVHPVSAGQ